MVKRPVAWASVVACVCAGMICAAMLAPARAFAIEPYPMSIAGTVTMTDGTPVPGVAVSIRSSYGDLQTATTDAAGEYRSGYLSDGVYSVEAEAEGLSSDGPYYVDVSWEGVRVDFVMARPQIAGRVTADGNAVAEAIIMLFRKSGSGLTVEALDFTGPDGHYGFAGVPDGDYVVGFERSEIAGVIYSDAFWRDATTVEAATSLPVDAASAHTGIDISLSRAHPSVTGTYSESGAGLADVLIRVYQRSTRGAWAPIDQERTGPDGTFTIHDLPTGAYRVGATSWIEGASAHPGGFYGGGASVATARDIYVTEGAPPVRITIAGAAIENVAPDAFEDDDDSSRAVPLVAGSSVAHTLAPIGDEDWVSFTAIAGHRYTVTTAVDPLRPAWSEWSDTGLVLFAADGRTVLARNDDPDGDSLFAVVSWTAPTTQMVLARVADAGWEYWGFPSYGAYALRLTDEVTSATGSIRGRVLDSVNGAPVPDAVVRLGACETVSATDGSYAFHGLGPGPQSVWVEASGYSPVGTTVQVPESPTGAVTLDIRIQPMSHSPGMIVGFVSCDGSPLADVQVAATGPSGQTATTIGDPDGRYRIEGLTPGTWTLRLSATDRVDKTMTVRVAPGGVSVANARLVYATGTIAGWVRDSLASRNVAGATVTLDGAPRTTTGADGSFRIDGVKLGAHTLGFSRPGYSARSVDVRAGAGVTSVEARIPFEPVFQNGYVRFANPDIVIGNLTYWLQDYSGFLSTETRETCAGGYWYGWFLAPGPARLVIVVPGYRSQYWELVVPEDGTPLPTFDVTMVPGEPGIVSGRVIDVGYIGFRPPRGDATVRLSSGQTTMTASDGTFLFEDVPLGTHTLTVEAPGCAVIRMQATVGSGSGRELCRMGDVQVHSSTLADRVVVTRTSGTSRTYRRRGRPPRARPVLGARMVTAHGMPVAGTTVVLQRRSGTRWVTAATRVTDAAGNVAVALSIARRGSYRYRWCYPGGLAPRAYSREYSFAVR